MNSDASQPIDPASIRRQAASQFNRVWALLDEAARTAEQDAEMIHAAIASRALWAVVGGDREACIGEWQIARVYAGLGMGELSMAHAQAAVGLSGSGELGPFLAASSHEGAARAAMVLGDRAAFETHRAASAAAAEGISDDEELGIWRADFEALTPPD